MKIQIRDIVSYLGRDYAIEGVATYRIAGQNYPLARAVDGDEVIWVEPLLNDADDRMLVFREVTDLDIVTPPPETIAYHGGTYLPRLSGAATIQLSGNAAPRLAGSYQVWRYRAAGDLFVQVEENGAKPRVLAGESVHKGMIDILPGK